MTTQFARQHSANGLFGRSMVCIAVGLVLVPVAGQAQYALGPSVFGGGGARTSGATYAVTSTIGQSGPVGVSTGATYSTHHGFWHAIGGGSPLTPMLLTIAQINPTAARISWAAVTGATFYEIYRSSTAFFDASGSPWRTVSAPTTSSDFAAGIGDPVTNYFFRGIARNASQASSPSNTVGEFDFGTGGAAAKGATAWGFELEAR